jgi:hypothetical protein
VTLKGEAKTKYQRDYMRRRRAEQRAKSEPTPKPTHEAAPQIDPAAVAELEARIRELEAKLYREEGVARGNFRAARKADAEIKRLKARIRKLEQEAIDLRLEAAAARQPRKADGMSFQTMSKIARVLHPDTRDDATERDKDEACKLFTAWKADKDKARRTAKS